MGVPRLAAAAAAAALLLLLLALSARAQSQPIGAYDPSPCAVLTPAARANDPSCNTDPVTPAPPPPDDSRRGMQPALQAANAGGGFIYGGRHNQYLNRVGYNSSAIPVVNDGVYQQLGDSCVAGASTTDFSSYCGRGLSCEGGVCVQVRLCGAPMLRAGRISGRRRRRHGGVQGVHQTLRVPRDEICRPRERDDRWIAFARGSAQLTRASPQAYAKVNEDCNDLTSPALPCASGLRCVQSGGLNAGAGTCQRGSNIPVPNVDPSVVPDAPVVANNTHCTSRPAAPRIARSRRR